MNSNTREGQNPSHEAGLKKPVEEYFAGLKKIIASGVDLERFSALIYPDEIKGLSDKVSDRYLDIFNLIRRERIPIENRINFDNSDHKIPSITEDMIIAILDDDTFEKLAAETKYRGPSLTISTREVARREVAKGLGWNILYKSAAPNGSFLGLNVFSPGSQMDITDWAIQSSAINFGPILVTRMIDSDQSGLDTDKAAVRAKAKIALIDPKCRFPSEVEFLAEAENLARNRLADIGIGRIRKEAYDVTNKMLLLSRS